MSWGKRVHEDGGVVSDGTTRRELLYRIAAGVAVAGTAGPLAGVAIAAEAGSGDPTRDTHTPKVSDGGVSVIAARRGPDGLPWYSVSGVYVGNTGDGILVALGPNQELGVVTVSLTGNTEVYARGAMALGDVSGLRSGDDLVVGTYFASDWSRVASYINCNSTSYWGWIESVEDSQFTVMADMPGGSPESRRVTCQVMPITTVLPAGKELTAGADVFVGALSDSPNDDTTLWAVTVNTTP